MKGQLSSLARPRALGASSYTATAAVLLLAACQADATETQEYGFDAIDVGALESTRAPRPKSDRQFLRSLYSDLVGRAPENYEFSVAINGQQVFALPVQEEAMLTRALEGASDVRPLRSVLVTALLASEETVVPEKASVSDPRAYISEVFRRYLGREPGPYELSAFVAEWEADPAVNPRSVLQAVLDSREYQSY